MANNRSDLINQLAASMGAGDYAKTKFEPSRYDADTGTLYCNGQIITKNTIDAAEQHFSQMYFKCDKSTSEGMQMAAIYQLALEGINQIRNIKPVAK